MTEPVRAALALGGNVGDVAASFAYALARLSEDGRTIVTASSSVYRTSPWGRADQPDFLNMAALVETPLAARDLLAFCVAIEKERGRIRRERWGPRTLDIDLIAYGENVIADAALTIPHLRAHERAFVLIPLLEIAPDLRIGAKTVREWAATCDTSGVTVDAEATASFRRLVFPSRH